MTAISVAILLIAALGASNDSLTCAESDQPSACESGEECPIIRLAPEFPVVCARETPSSETVVVSAIVATDGRVRSAEIVKSTNDCLNEAALKNICRWRYEPLDAKKSKEKNRFIVTKMTFELAD
jgi:TonB family protein